MTERERAAQIPGRMVLLRREIDDVRTAERLDKIISELTDKMRERQVDNAGPVVSTCPIERAPRAHIELQAIRVPPQSADLFA